MKRIADVIIIGAGPAGVSCAMQLKRHGIEPLLIEKGKVGGLLHNASEIENLPGFPESITAEKLIAKLEAHLEVTGIHPVQSEVTSVIFEAGSFKVNTHIGAFSSSLLVIATGTVPIFPKPFSEELPYIIADISHIKEVARKDIAIIGAGDAAFDYALQLAEKDNTISIFNRGSQIRALPLLKERADSKRNVNYYENYRVSDIDTNIGTNSLSVSFHVENSTVKYNFDYLIFATGRIPAVSFLDKSVIDNKDDLISAGKLFFIGDVKGGRYRQAAIAAGEGIKIAMIISNEGNQKD